MVASTIIDRVSVPARHWKAFTSIGAIGAGVLVVLLALPYFDHVADYDEFYSLLAARGWLETGAPVIADGAYPRAFAFTLLQAAFVSFLGDGFIAARLPSLLCVALLAAGLFVWVSRQAGLFAAALSAAIFAFTPLTIQMAQFGRFYSLHAVTVWCTALLVYGACAATTARARAAFGAGALVGLLFALHLQETTVIALCAFATWIAAVVGGALLQSDRPPRTKRTVVVSALVAAIALGGVVVWSGLGERLWTSFQTTTLWGSGPGRADNIRFYHQGLNEDLGLLWSLFPIASVAAILSRRREMWFAATFVAITLVLHSLAAQKDGRYVFYVLPFIAALLGVGLGAILDAYSRWIRRTLPGVAGSYASHRAVPLIATVLIVVSAAFPFVNNPSFVDATRMLAGAPKVRSIDYSWIADWPAELDVLRPLAQEPAILATSSGMKAIYYLGDYDFELNANVVDETDTRRDFGIDERTGRQAVSSPESVELLLRCYGDIVFVIDESRWSRDTAVPVATSAWIEKHATRVPTRPQSALLVFRARASASPNEFCKELRPGRRS